MRILLKFRSRVYNRKKSILTKNYILKRKVKTVGLFNKFGNYFADSFADLSKPGFLNKDIVQMESVYRDYVELASKGFFEEDKEMFEVLSKCLAIIRNVEYEKVPADILNVLYDCFTVINNNAFSKMAHMDPNKEKMVLSDMLKFNNVCDNALNCKSLIRDKAIAKMNQ